LVKTSQEVANKLKKIWMRLALRGVHYSNDYGKLDAIYLVHDPWRMDSPSQRYRFAETNQLILKEFGVVESLLEIGCGEGHQSLHLERVCDHLTGLDVSVRAVKRARRRCPRSKFLVGDIFSQEVGALAPFDLVVACEVLYYMNDVPAALRRMRALGRNCLVSYFDREMGSLDQQVLDSPGIVSGIMEYQNTRYRVAWLRGEQV
jgi:SAM-dependent methyltransferase